VIVAVNFNNIDEDQFEEMCRQLVLLENPAATPVEAKPGDEGLDSFVGVIDRVVKAFQFKHFPNGFAKSQRDQTRKSLVNVIKKHNPKKWTLLVSADLDPKTLRWVEKQKRDFPEVEIEVVPASKIRNLLDKHVGVRQVYFPLTDEKTDALFRAMGGKGLLTAPTPEAHLLNEMRRDAAIINNSDPLFRLIVETSDEGQTLRVEPRGPQADGVTIGKMKFNFPTEDKDALEAYKRFQRDMEAGRPVTVAGKYVELEEYRFAHQMPKGFDEVRIAPNIPDRRFPARLTARSGDDEATLNYLEMRLIRQGKAEEEYSNAGQKSPVTISVTVKKSPPATFNASVRNYAGLRPSQVVAGERFLNILSKPDARMELTGLENNVTLGSAISPGASDFSDSRRRYFEDLAIIEHQLDPDIVIPKEVEDSDPYAVAEIAQALTTGSILKQGNFEGNFVPNDKQEFLRITREQPELLTFVHTGVREISLFGKAYEFDTRVIMNEPVQVIEEHADGSLKVEMEGNIEVTYTNGRVAADLAETPGPHTITPQRAA